MCVADRMFGSYRMTGMGNDRGEKFWEGGGGAVLVGPELRREWKT